MTFSYIFDADLFRENFDYKDKKSPTELRITHNPNNRFKLYPYSASPHNTSPIVMDLSDVLSGFFRKSLNISTEAISFEDLCEILLQDMVEIENGNPVAEEMFRDLIRYTFFKDDNFQANNIGLYAYQTSSDKKLNTNAAKIAEFLYCVLGLNEQDKERIKKAEEEYPFNVLEEMVYKSLKVHEQDTLPEEERYFPVKKCIQEIFREDFKFMLLSGMTTVDDLSNLLSFYYFYYVSQCSLTLNQFGNGKRDKTEELYFALDWEKVSKNRLCCQIGWDRLSNNLSRMFSHAITLEILNQNNLRVMDYIDFKHHADDSHDLDVAIANEIKRAESIYISCVGDYKYFDKIPNSDSEYDSLTDAAIRHLFMCVDNQFKNSSRKRAYKLYSDKFTNYCKGRFVKNRKKSGLVLNLTERDILFLTKLALRDNDKIRLNDLYDEYEKRGIYLDTTSKALLQEFFTKLNLIDKKSDSGDAQYVKRIL